LGTFNDLDGGMVIMDGKVYQLRSDGHAYEVPASTKSPFSCVTFFKPYSFENIDEPLSY
jgi:acetolactate decarboxylase